MGNDADIFRIVSCLCKQRPIDIFIFCRMIMSVDKNINAIYIHENIIRTVPPIGIFTAQMSNCHDEVTFILFF